MGMKGMIFSYVRLNPELELTFVGLPLFLFMIKAILNIPHKILQMKNLRFQFDLCVFWYFLALFYKAS